MTSYPTFKEKHISAYAIFVKIGKIIQFDDRKRVKKSHIDSDIFDGDMTSLFFEMTSYPTFSKKHTSAEAIFIKIVNIVPFDDRKRGKKFHIDSDIFDGDMTSLFF